MRARRGRPRPTPVERRQLGLAADQLVVRSPMPVILPEQAVAQLDGVPAGLHAELGAQRAVEPVELAQGAVAVTRRRVTAHQLQVRPLVAGVDGHDVVPALEQREQRHVEPPEPLPGAAAQSS